MGWDGCGGCPGTDLDDIGWYGHWTVLDGYEGLGWVRRAWDWGEGPRMVVKGQVIVWRPRMGMKGLIWV